MNCPSRLVSTSLAVFSAFKCALALPMVRAACSASASTDFSPWQRRSRISSRLGLETAPPILANCWYKVSLKVRLSIVLSNIRIRGPGTLDLFDLVGLAVDDCSVVSLPGRNRFVHPNRDDETR